MSYCDKCDFVFATDRNVPADLYEVAYTKSGDYQGHLAQAEKAADISRYRWDVNWVLGQVRPNGRKRILDLGCGVGAVLAVARKLGWEPHGQDVSENALRVAREVYHVNTISGELGQIIASRERFDFVTAFHLLEHTPDPLAYLKQVRQLIADGGRFGLAVPNYRSYVMQNTTCEQWLPPFHLNFFTRRSLRAAMERAGFKETANYVKLVSFSGLEGSKPRRMLLVPYLLANAAIGRLNGSILVAIAEPAATKV